MLFNYALAIFSRMNDMALSSMTFEMMQNSFDIEPDKYSYNALLKTTTDIQHGMDMFKQMMENDNINDNINVNLEGDSWRWENKQKDCKWHSEIILFND